jgi:hypothetical protein
MNFHFSFAFLDETGTTPFALKYNDFFFRAFTRKKYNEGRNKEINNEQKEYKHTIQSLFITYDFKKVACSLSENC